MTLRPLEIRPTSSFTTVSAVSLEKSLNKDTNKPFILGSPLPPPPPPQQLSSVSHLVIRNVFISSDGDFIIYVLHFLVLLIGDEGKEDSSRGSLKIPTLIPENPGKFTPAFVSSVSSP